MSTPLKLLAKTWGVVEHPISNSEATDALEEATDSPAVQRTKAALQEGQRLLSERQKLIKIADRSTNGWSVVAEYTADELADDSDDEKRLEKAEKAAERKAGQKRRRRQQPVQKGAMPRGQRYPGAPGLQGGVYPAHPHYSVPFPLQQQQQALGVGQSGRRTTGAGASQQRTVVGPCFACGEMGHLRTYCPRAQTSEKKWYPHQIFVCMPERVWEGASTCHRGPPGVGKLPDANDCDAVSGAVQ